MSACTKMGRNELETVRNLMAMSLRAIVADALRRDLDEVCEACHLYDDLGMTRDGRRRLAHALEETFDGFAFDPSATPTFGDLLQAVVHDEFEAGRRS